MHLKCGLDRSIFVLTVTTVFDDGTINCIVHKTLRSCKITGRHVIQQSVATDARKPKIFTEMSFVKFFAFVRSTTV